MSKLFQITEEDLESLEATLPELQLAMMPLLNDPMLQKRLSMCKKILSDVRWNYGPPTEVGQVEA